jgi:hypothetical protein
VTVDGEALHERVILRDDISHDRVGVPFLHVADFQVGVALPGDPAIQMSLHTVDRKLEIARRAPGPGLAIAAHHEPSATSTPLAWGAHHLRPIVPHGPTGYQDATRAL